MTPQVVLNRKESNQGAPVGYWTITLTPSNRTSNSITITCDASCSLNSDNSKTQFGVTCSLYIGGAWHDFVMVPYGTWWTGTTAKTASTSIIITGLTETQTNLSGIKFKAWAGDSEGPGISETSCSDVTFDSFSGGGVIMTPQVVLSNSQSSLSSPYGFWTVTLTPRDRTTNSVTIDCEMSCSLQYSSSYTGYQVTCGMYLGGSWHDVEINPSGNSWSGTTARTARMTVTVTGLTASQTLITGIYFRAWAADGWGPGTADKACANLVIASANAASEWALDSDIVNIDESLSVLITPIVDSNYHIFELVSNDNKASLGQFTNTSPSITIPAEAIGSWFDGDALSLAATLAMYSYAEDGTYLGKDEKAVTINMTAAAGAPTDVVITDSSVSKGLVIFNIVPPVAKYNAHIVEQSYQSNIGEILIDGATVTVSIPSGAEESVVTISITATDTRGYTVSSSGSITYNGESIFDFGTTSVNLNQSIDIAIDEWVASNTYSLSANSVVFADKRVDNSIRCKFAEEDFSHLFGSNSATANVTMVCSTYDSLGNQIGSNLNKVVSLIMPRSIGAPTGTKLTIVSVTDTEIIAKITSPTTKYGATISNYVVSTNNGVAVLNGDTITVTNNAGFKSGRVKISVYAIDSRGFNSNTATVEKIFTNPKIVLNGASYEKIMSNEKNVIAIYRGSTRIM